MAWVKIPFLDQIQTSNDVNAAGYVVKCYSPGTTDNIPMAIGSDGSTQVNTATLNADGFPEVSGNEVALYIDQDFKIAVYENASDASNDTNAFWGPIDNISISDLFKTKIVNPVADYDAIRNLTNRQLENNAVLHVTNAGIAGSGVLRNVPSHVLTDNGGTIIVINSNWYWERDYEGALNPLWFEAIGDGVTDDSAACTACSNALAERQEMVFPAGYEFYLATGMTYKSRVTYRGENKSGTRVFSNYDGPVFSKSGQAWKTQFKNLTIENNYNGSNAAGIQGSGYQMEILSNSFIVNYGSGVKLLGSAYSVENRITDNYFVRTKIGIEAQSDTHSNTDAWVIDNYFYGDGYQQHAIKWNNPSGSTFRGNHPYGNSTNGFFNLTAGLNVSIIGNYFESDEEPRITIIGGNPSSYTVTANTFWEGDGTETDVNGDQSSLISLSFNTGNLEQFTFTGNVFEGGTNSVPIFNLLNGSHSNVSDIHVKFDKSNALNGSYSLAISGASGSNTNLRIVESDHEEFNYFSTSQNLSPSNVASSEFFQQNSGFATGNPTLPSSTAWLKNKRVRFNNISTSHTAAFNTSHGGGISGNKSPNPEQVAPGAIADIMLVDGNYYIMHLKL